MKPIIYAGLCGFRNYGLRLICFNTNTKETKAIQLPMVITNSETEGGAIRIKPRPLISDEKLETQKGMRNSLNVCQWSGGFIPEPPTLSSRAKPITPLIPTEFSQIAGDGSK